MNNKVGQKSKKFRNSSNSVEFGQGFIQALLDTVYPYLLKFFCNISRFFAIFQDFCNISRFFAIFQDSLQHFKLFCNISRLIYECKCSQYDVALICCVFHDINSYAQKTSNTNTQKRIVCIASGIYSSNVLIFFPSEYLPAPNVQRFGGKIWAIFQGK